jgi:hypothetical protein
MVILGAIVQPALDSFISINMLVSLIFIATSK